MPEAPPVEQGLALAGVVAGYGEGTELHGVDLQVLPGERVGLLGRNGAGKTTLLRTVMGLTRVDEGSMSFAGQDLRQLPTFAVARLGLAYVPQGRELFGDFTVEQNLLTGVLGLQGSRSGLRDLSVALRAFPFLAGRLQERAGALSGGQQQQLAIGRALAGRPSLLMLDEPTEGIQPSVIKDIGRVLRRLAQQGLDGQPMAVLLVEQYYDFAAELADRYVVLERGRVIAQGLGADMARDGVKAKMAI